MLKIQLCHHRNKLHFVKSHNIVVLFIYLKKKNAALMSIRYFFKNITHPNHLKSILLSPIVSTPQSLNNLGYV